MKSFMGQIKTDILNLLYPLKEFNKEHPFKSYHTVVENHAFAVFAPKNETIVAAHENIVCTQKSGDKNTLYLYPDIRRMRMRHRINVNENAFRGLIHGSNVQTVLLLPFIDKKDGNRSPSCRMVIITDKCQIFHNRPENRHGKKGAETEFSESMIWDLPGKKHPSPNEKCEEYEFFYPFLPESAYEYHPAGETPKYLEVYGPDGKKEVLSRFYIPNRAVLSNPFSYMGGYEPDYMVSLIGTYLGNSTKETAGRIVVFATTDGGKNWFAKYEFNDSGASGNYGNAVRCREVELNKTSVPSQMYLVKRELVPSETEGMVLRSGQRQAINSIRWGETVELVFKEQHGLTSGDIIALKG